MKKKAEFVVRSTHPNIYTHGKVITMPAHGKRYNSEVIQRSRGRRVGGVLQSVVQRTSTACGRIGSE